jgi:hypothetical protein
MARIAAVLAGPLLLAAAVTAIVRQDAGVLVRAVLVQLPVAAIGTGAAMTVAGLALGATDELCTFVSRGTDRDTASLLNTLIQLLTHTGNGAAGGFAVVLVCLLLLVGGFMLTLELIMRTAAISVATLFLPLTMAGMLWPATARWSRRLAEMLAVLILSKFVVVAIIAMAVSALAGSLAGGGLSSLLAGAALLLLAGTAPFTLLRMVPIVEAAAIGHLEGTGRRMAPPLPADPGDLLKKLIPPAAGAPGIVAATPDLLPVYAAARGLADDGTQDAPDRPAVDADEGHR